MSDAGAAQRLDKWLWAARFFKTRTQAQEAVNGGKVHVDGERVKPARAVRVGQMLEITRGEAMLTVRIEGLAERRGPATVAATLYAETDESVARREAAAAARRERRELRDAYGGRPDKRSRRQLSDLKRAGDD